MTLSEIRKYIARNLGMLSSDNSTIIEGNITKAGLDDEINRVYLEVIAQQMIYKSGQDFTVESRQNTFRAFFTVSAIDVPNKKITSTTSVFGRADIGVKIQNPITGTFYTISTVISSTQVIVEEVPSATWVGTTVFILNNIIILDGEMKDFKEILKVQIKYADNDIKFLQCKKETISNFKDLTNNEQGNIGINPVYALSTIEQDEVMKRIISYYPYPNVYDGEIRITYTKLPEKLTRDDQEPALNAIGVSETIINGVTAWGLKAMGEVQKSAIYEENNPVLGGIVPKGLGLTMKNYAPERNSPLKYKSVRR